MRIDDKGFVAAMLLIAAGLYLLVYTILLDSEYARPIAASVLFLVASLLVSAAILNIHREWKYRTLR